MVDPAIEWLAVEFVALILTDIMDPEGLADAEWRRCNGDMRLRDYYGRLVHEHHEALYFAQTRLRDHPLIELLKIHPDHIIDWAMKKSVGTLEFAGIDGRRRLKTSLNIQIGRAAARAVQ